MVCFSYKLGLLRESMLLISFESLAKNGEERQDEFLSLL